MNKQMKVANVMSSNLITLHPKDKLTKAKKLFRQHRIHHILVCVMDEIRGIISYGDILFLEGMVTTSFDRFLRTKKSEHTPVEDIMTANPYRIQVDATLTEALDMMLDHHINALPVLEDEKTVGIITTRDILTTLNQILKSNE